MEDKDIKEIIYEFDPDAILGDLSDSEYDADETKKRYEELCRAELRNKYPDTLIDIRESYKTQNTVKGGIDPSEISLIEELCIKVWINQDYLVRHPEEIADTNTYYPLVHDDFTLAVGLLRWSCKNQLIDGANRNGFVWTTTQASFYKFRRTFIKGNTESSAWLIKTVGDTISSIIGIDYAQFFKLGIAEALQEGEKILIAADLMDMPTLFLSTNCYGLLSRNDKTYQLTIAIFDDVDEWRHPSGFTFSKFINTFYETTRASREENCRIEKVLELESKTHARYSLELRYQIADIPGNSLENSIAKVAEQLSRNLENVEIRLRKGLPWDVKYEQGAKAEKDFREEYLTKLLQLLDYEVVRLEHGPFEFGKDIIFAETTKFGVRRYFALQAKKGDLSGDAKNDMDIIMNQIEDAFSVPFQESQTLEFKYISGVIIAISGNFTNNAKEKVWARLLRQGRVGMVYFWDREIVQDLMRLASLDRKLSGETQKNMMPNYLKEV